MHAWLWRLTAVYLAIGAAACATTSQAVEMLVKGDTTDLRDDDEFAPIAPAKPRILVIAIDGVDRNLLYGMLKEGKLPKLAALISANGSFDDTYFAPNMLATLPSSTIPAWTTAMTGVPPGEHGVPGNEYFVRSTRKFEPPIPTTFASSAPVLETLTDHYVDELIQVPTVYDRMREAEPGIEIWVGMHQIHKGADRLLGADRQVMFQAFDAFVIDANVDRAQGETSNDFYALVDNKLFDTVEEEIKEDGVPDVLTLYISGTDLFAHVAEKGPDEARANYLFDILEPLFDTLRQSLETKGALHDTFVVVTADHGHTQVVHDEKHALDTSMETDPPSVLAKADFRIRPFEHEVDDDHDFQAVFAYQGAMAYVYLADRSTCAAPETPCKWSRRPRYKEDVLAAADAFHRATTAGDPVPEMKGTLHMILVRPDGEKLRPFEVYVGDEKTESIEAWLSHTPQPEYVELATRLEHLTMGKYGDRAGDIILIANNGNKKDPRERFYFSHPYHSWHGSPSRRDSEIPFIVAHRGRSTSELRTLVSPILGETGYQQNVTDVLLELRKQPSIK